MAILQNQITQQPSFFDGMDDDIPDQNKADVKTGTSFFDGMDDEEPEDKDVDNKLIIPPHLDPDNFNQGVSIPPVETEVDEIDDEPFVLFRNVKKGKEEVNQAYLQTFSPLVENNEQLLELLKICIQKKQKTIKFLLLSMYLMSYMILKKENIKTK